VPARQLAAAALAAHQQHQLRLLHPAAVQHLSPLIARYHQHQRQRHQALLLLQAVLSALVTETSAMQGRQRNLQHRHHAQALLLALQPALLGQC
jgi:hypothetical protein